MPEHRPEEHLDVLRDDVLAAVQERPGARGALERERAPDGGAELDDVEVPRCPHEAHDPALQQRIDVDVLDGALQCAHLGDRDNRTDALERMAVALVEHDLPLVVLARVAERRAKQEPVELGLGQEERALLLDRVLGCEQQERRGEAPRDPVDGDLPLGHRLEERGLGLLRGAVDLVDEDDVREDRSRPELEVALLLIEDRRAGHVGRLEIGRALDA